jgi:MFS family permease
VPVESAVSAVQDGAGAAGSYRRLLGQPVLRGLAVADVCARLPQGMVTITLLLLTAAHASMTTAGLVVGGYTIGQAVTGPLRGRFADRYGLVPVAVACSIGYALALTGLVAGALAREPADLLVAAAAGAGLVVPPLSPGMRSLWALYAEPGLRHAAFALDAAVFDLAYIAGPALASALATGIAPTAAVGVLVAGTGAAVIIIGVHSRRAKVANVAQVADNAKAEPSGPQPRARRSVLGPLRSAELRSLLVTGALANAALSGAEVALTAYTRHHHALWASGLLLAEVSVGSVLGSLLLGTRRPAGDSHRRLARLLGCYALGLALLTAAGLDAPLLAVAAPVAGLCLGPTLATLFSMAASAAPRSAGTETQAWLNSAMNGGAAAGAVLAGLTASWPVLALATTALTATVAAVSAVVAAPAFRQMPHNRSAIRDTLPDDPRAAD